MAGKPGRSGRRPLPVALHLAKGTYRADRHGPKPAVSGALALAPAVPPMPKTLVAGLREPGLRYVADIWAAYADIGPADVAVLHEAGAAVDLLHDLEVAIAAGGSVVDDAGVPVANPLLRVQRQTRAALVMLINKLALRE